MISIDTNILLYAISTDSPYHNISHQYLQTMATNQRFAVCELVLTELYTLLRNPLIIKPGLSGQQAVEIIQGLRSNPDWTTFENAPVMDQVWAVAAHAKFPRGKIYDARIAYTLLHHGVTEFVTANTKDFKDFGFEKLTNPLEN